MTSAEPPKPLRIERVPDALALARRGAEVIADHAREAIEQRGLATVCLSGGSTPVPMFHELARCRLDWERVHVLQVDERVAPRGSGARNLTSIEHTLGQTGAQIYPMPVELGAAQATGAYSESLYALAGRPARIDIMHLGIGDDGHTASLFPGDPALESREDLLVVGEHAGWARMTLTLNVINRSRAILWLVSGEGKRGAQAKLINADRSIPASLVERKRALLLTDLPA